MNVCVCKHVCVCVCVCVCVLVRLLKLKLLRCIITDVSQNWFTITMGGGGIWLSKGGHVFDFQVEYVDKYWA